MEKLKQNLKGKKVVITGATSGVGLAAVQAFAQEGCNIVAAARGEEGIEQVLEYCRSVNIKALGISADVSVAQDVERIAQQAPAINEKIDVWVNMDKINTGCRIGAPRFNRQLKTL